MSREHHYSVVVEWTGNLGGGTSSYRAYSRDHAIRHPRAGATLASSDPAFRGDASRWSPEQLFLASLAQCHMLWYLHLAADAGVVVISYEDEPTGAMFEERDGSGQFTEVTLHPRVTITAGSDAHVVHALHERAGSYCFIARSVSIPVRHQSTVARQSEAESSRP